MRRRGRTRARKGASLVVSPHAENPDDSLLLEYLVDDAVLDIDAPGIRAVQVTDQLFVRRRIPERVASQDRQEIFRFAPEPRPGNFPGILERVLGKDDLPLHHLTALALRSSGSAMPFLMDSRMPGTDRRYKVSCIASQS